SQHSLHIDLQPMRVEPGGVGQRLAHALVFGHGGDEREGTIFVGVVERGEVLGVVQSRDHDVRSKRYCRADGWSKARWRILLPEAAMRARGMSRRVHGDLRR